MEQTRNRERLLAFIAKNAESGCWEWRGQVSNSGYGRLMINGPDGSRMESAHRASYVMFMGPIPDGAMIQQTCSNRLCVNPDHLQVVEQVGGTF